MLRALFGALSLLTIIPTPDHYPDAPGRAYAYFPLVGVLVGSVVIAALSLGRVISPGLGAWAGVVGWVVITGGLHLDGAGDACDGLFAVAEPEKRLAIMKDSRAGVWAVVGVVVLLLGKWSALQVTAPADVVLAAVTGRTVMVFTTVGFPYARAQGMGGYFREGIGRGELMLAGGTFAVVLVALPGGLVVVGGVLLLVWWAANWAAGRLGGGLTGDVYGALCELSELLVLVLMLV
jgi:adenosylcobinamide-GDP ribazoletransferase